MPLAILSPAKTFNEKLRAPPFPCTEPAPALEADRQALLAVLRGLSKTQLKSLMAVSDALAELNVARYARFEAQASMNAAVAFDGPAHKAFSFGTLEPAGRAYAQEHVITLSGLYGCLRPMDAVRPHRLEMGTRLHSERGDSLYAFWEGKIATQLLEWLGALPEAQRFIVNVASQEYWNAIGKYVENAAVWHIEFPGPAVYAKQARGLFCRFLAEERIVDARDLERFAPWAVARADALGCAFGLYSRSSDERGGGRLRFERTSPPAAAKAVKGGARAAPAKSAAATEPHGGASRKRKTAVPQVCAADEEKDCKQEEAGARARGGGRATRQRARSADKS
jgi:cytoplasmic iron level regulating protein YaaA (DUF328/UPF0246 family)